MSSGSRRYRSPPPPSLEATNSRSASDEDEVERRPSRPERRTITTMRSGSNSRTRPPTPVVRRSARARQLSDDYIFNDDDSVSNGSDQHDSHRHRGHHDHHHHHHHHNHDDRHARHRHVSIDARPDGLRGAVGAAASAVRRQVTANTADTTTSRRANSSSYLTWYERMVPECLLTLSAPITGYERRLVTRPGMDEHELEILERDRLRRNKRTRRRVFTVVLIASIASAYFFWRGRVPGRRVHGVRGAIGSVADGISKSIQDTMGK